ncbi:MAG: methylated-DNA--[protein]-cysteine S-methyltransferase [Solirubrobacteraceae bacterium]
MKLELGQLPTPLGDARFARSGARVFALAFAECWAPVGRALERRLGPIEWTDAGEVGELGTRLDAYFAGDLSTLDGVEIELAGTAFQRRVWSALREIPAGETIAYGALAHRLGAPDAMRAVGAANGANPLWLLVPCHRAIAADGSLTGYAGGIERKRWLLAHESGAARRSAR